MHYSKNDIEKIINNEWIEYSKKVVKTTPSKYLQPLWFYQDIFYSEVVKIIRENLQTRLDNAF